MHGTQRLGTLQKSSSIETAGSALCKRPPLELLTVGYQSTYLEGRVDSPEHAQFVVVINMRTFQLVLLLLAVAAVRAAVSHQSESVPSTSQSLRETLQGGEEFAQFENFTAGLFYGFQSRPQKPCACMATYNETAAFFRNISTIIDGCVELSLVDCEALKEYIPDSIIHTQALELTCKLSVLRQAFEHLLDPISWASIISVFMWNKILCTSLFHDLKPAYEAEDWRRVGVDVGSLIRVLLNFSIN